jgi:hypothetical protein
MGRPFGINYRGINRDLELIFVGKMGGGGGERANAVVCACGTDAPQAIFFWGGYTLLVESMPIFS